MKTFYKLIVGCICMLSIAIQAKPISDYNACSKTLNCKTEKKWQSSTFISTGLTAGAFSQQYYKYLRTDVAVLFIFVLRAKQYEYSVQRYYYYLPSIALNRIYSKSNFTNLRFNVEFQQGVANSTNTNKAITLLTSRINFNKKYFGLGMGVTLGNSLFKENVYDYGEEKIAKTNYASSRFLIDLRLGRLDIIYFETSRMNPVTLDEVDYSYGIGTGFGSMNKFALRIGRYDKFINTGTYSELRVPIGKNTFVNVFGGYINNIKRKVAVVPDSEKYNEINTYAWYAGFRMNWYL